MQPLLCLSSWAFMYGVRRGELHISGDLYWKLFVYHLGESLTQFRSALRPHGMHVALPRADKDGE